MTLEELKSATDRLEPHNLAARAAIKAANKAMNAAKTAKERAGAMAAIKEAKDKWVHEFGKLALDLKKEKHSERMG